MSKANKDKVQPEAGNDDDHQEPVKSSNTDVKESDGAVEDGAALEMGAFLAEQEAAENRRAARAEIEDKIADIAPGQDPDVTDKQITARDEFLRRYESAPRRVRSDVRQLMRAERAIREGSRRSIR